MKISFPGLGIIIVTSVQWTHGKDKSPFFNFIEYLMQDSFTDSVVNYGISNTIVLEIPQFTT